MRLVKVIGVDQFGNEIEKIIDIDETLAQLLAREFCREIKITYVSSREIEQVTYDKWPITPMPQDEGFF